MPASKALLRSVEVFESLGWGSAEASDAANLPLGDTEQQSQARSGLMRGSWVEDAELSPNVFGTKKVVDVELRMLAFFAIRLGVPAERAARLLSDHGGHEPEVCALVLNSCEQNYVIDVLTFLVELDSPEYNYRATLHGTTTVTMVQQYDLPLPDSRNYFHDWTIFAHEHFVDVSIQFNTKSQPSIPRELVEKRFEEHLLGAASSGVPADPVLVPLVRTSVDKGLVSEEFAIEVAMTGLVNAPRPSDRKHWCQLLTKNLNLESHQLLEFLPQLSQVIAVSEPIVVETVGVPLLKVLDGPDVLDVALPCLYATTKKAQRQTLSALAGRVAPTGVDLEPITLRLRELIEGNDEKISVLAESVLVKWGIAHDEATCSRGDVCINTDCAEQVEVGAELWRETPPVWQVPRFERGPVSPEAFALLMSDVLRASKDRLASHMDVESERLLAVAVELSTTDLPACRQVLKSVDRRFGPCSVMASSDADDENVCIPADFEPVVAQRSRVVTRLLGTLPCLLSEPSFDDLSICLSDVIARLAKYEAAGVAVQAADLYLALCRLRPEETMADHVVESSVVVCFPDGTPLNQNAGQLVTAYLTDPWVCPAELPVGSASDGCDVLSSRPAPVPCSLRVFGFDNDPEFARKDLEFPDSFGYRRSRPQAVHHTEHYGVFPNQGDPTLTALRWWARSTEPSLGVVSRQVARRSVPLTPGGAVNLLSMLRCAEAKVTEGVALAVDEAWVRGLLRPGVADYGLLGWVGEPSHVKQFVAALVDVAHTGLLSVVWPVLDSVIAESLSADRLRPGTAEAVEAVEEFLPHAIGAVAQGVADSSVFDLPGVRSLACAKGTSKAVKVARRVVKALPDRP